AAREPDRAIQKAAATPPADATAYAAGDKASAEEAPPLTADTAPIALHAAVRPPAAKALIHKAAKPRVTKTAELSKARTRGLTAPAAAHGSDKDKTAATAAPTPLPT